MKGFAAHRRNCAAEHARDAEACSLGLAAHLRVLRESSAEEVVEAVQARVETISSSGRRNEGAGDLATAVQRLDHTLQAAERQVPRLSCLTGEMRVSSTRVK